MYHNPVPAPCPVCVVSAGGPSEPPLLDVWSGLMFTVLLTECWRIWADMSPQCSLPACLLDWLCSHIPSVRRHLWRGWATACYSLACVSPCLSLTLWQELTPAKMAGFSQRSKHRISTDSCKENKDGLIKMLNSSVAMLEKFWNVKHLLQLLKFIQL